jgi:phospholipid transport system substrate-binding protein
MRSSWTATGLALLMLVASPVLADEDPRAVLEEISGRVLSVLDRDDLTSEQRVLQIEQVVEGRLDFALISRLVLARNYRKLSPEQRDEFAAEFKQHLSSTYGRGIDNYAGGQVEIGEAHTESNGDVTVRTTWVRNNRDGARVDYRMRQRDGSWYVIDVVIEGLSLVRNFRVQIQEIVSSKGVDQLIETLREKNALEGEPAPQP